MPSLQAHVSESAYGFLQDRENRKRQAPASGVASHTIAECRQTRRQLSGHLPPVFPCSSKSIRLSPPWKNRHTDQRTTTPDRIPPNPDACLGNRSSTPGCCG